MIKELIGLTCGNSKGYPEGLEAKQVILLSFVPDHMRHFKILVLEWQTSFNFQATLIY